MRGPGTDGEGDATVGSKRATPSPSQRAGGTGDDDTLVAADRPRDREASTRLWQGMTVGRYVILEMLGGGGMGIVYAAYDPKLDRKIAIKIIAQHPGKARASTDGTLRLLREAQAMARLTHPNVIAVHDVGTHEDTVFVAMEHVDGTTLQEHLDTHRDAPWRSTLALFGAAGRGLAAAHAVGLVHRDFKPENVMVDRSGRVIVLDFGLARGLDTPSESLDDGGEPLAMGSAAALRLTATGAVMGTPAYMAPEQHRGEPIDHRSDQFSFCVALFQGLYGYRPFSGGTIAEVAGNVLHGRVADPPKTTAVPQSVHKAILRGLARDPQARFASMQALLEALARDPNRPRRRWALGTATAIAIGMAAWVGGRVGASTPCADAAEDLREVWNPTRSAELSQALARSEKAWSSETTDRAVAMLDAYARAWAQMREDACVQTRVRGEQSDAVLTARMRCLDRRLARLDAVVGALARADEDLRLEAVAAVESLPAIDDCADIDALLADVAPPDDARVRAIVEDLRLRMDANELAFDRRASERLIDRAKGFVAEARAIDYPPVLAEALVHLAGLEWDSVHTDAAAAALEEALFVADAAGHHRIAMLAATNLIRAEGIGRNRYEVADAYARRVEATMQHVDADPEVRLRFLLYDGQLQQVRGRGAAAIERFEQALAWAAEHGLERTGVSQTVRYFLGSAYITARRYSDAHALLAAAHETAESSRGPNHPAVADVLVYLGRLHRSEGHDQLALDSYSRAEAIYRSALGPSHPNVATVLNSLALLYESLGRFEEAEAAFTESLAIVQDAYGAEHHNAGAPMSNLGNLLRRLGHSERAIDLHRRALTIRANMGAERHAFTQSDLGDDLRAAGRCDDALPHFDRAIALLTDDAGPADPRLDAPLIGKSMCLLAAGQTDDAHALAQRVHAILAATDVDNPRRRAAASLALARTTHAQGDRDRARALTQQAQALLMEDATANAPELAALAAFAAELQDGNAVPPAG